MAAERERVPVRRWYFSREELANSPSRGDGVDPEKELRYRQDAASLIQDMGPKLNLNVLCMSTAIVYMHRFYMINSFKAFDRVIIATAALFLAAKVEEHPRKLEHVAKCSYALLHKDNPDLDCQSEAYTKLIDDITSHELILLQTLGFDVQVKHPHPSVVHCMNLVGVSRDLSQAAFFLAHNSQLLTTYCLEHPPTVVACMCIHLTCAWKGLEIPRSSDDKNWWEYVDHSVTHEKLEALATEFLTIVEKSPSRLKKRIQENIRMAVEGSRPSGTHTSLGQGNNRHAHSMATPIMSNHKHNKDQSTTKQHLMKSHHHHHHIQSKSKQHSTVPDKQQAPSVKPGKESSSHQNSQNKHHHAHPDFGTNSLSRKHPLPKDHPPSHHQKHKRLKMEDGGPHPSGRQSLTLDDYRQSKRQHEIDGGRSNSKSSKMDTSGFNRSSKGPTSHSLPPLPPIRSSPPPPPPPRNV